MSLADKNQVEGKTSKLTAKQESAISALLSTSTIKEAAKCANVGEATIFRWLQLEDFQTAYREARRQTVNHAIAQLQKACSEAVGTLRDVMKDKDSPPSSRVSAAKAVLETSIKAVELEDLISRVEELEELVNDKK
jgi:hypothetical protein